MRQVSLIAMVSVVALFIGGCPASDEGDQAGTISPSPAPAVSPNPPKPSPATTFGNPLTPKQQGNPKAVAGLIQTLPPEARVKQIAKGRSDPFAFVPVQPEVNYSPTTTGGGGTSTRPVPPVPALPRPQRPPQQSNAGAGGRGPTAPRPNVVPPRPNLLPPRPNVLPPRAQPRPKAKTPPVAARPGTGNLRRPGPGSSPRPGNRIAARPGTGSLPRPNSGLLPPLVPPPRLAPELPNLPEPTLAQGIEVTGVVEVGGVSKAIVKVPNEPSRTVQPGDRLSNGQVLVKRIELRGPTPVVILEQYGIEVARQVGEQPTGGPGGPTASLPVPRPVNN